MHTPQPNPFRPSFGVSPLVLAGRTDLLSGFPLALLEGPGSPLRTMLVSGPRGSGKTVLLNELEEAARVQGWIVLRAYPGADMLTDLTATEIPRTLAALYGDRPARRVTGASIAGLGSMRTETTEPEHRPAATLISELRTLAERLRAHGTGIVISVDEVQSADPEHLRAVATAVQDLVRDDHDVAFLAAGLPAGITALLQHPGTTFLRRAELVTLGPVTAGESADAVAETVAAGGREITPEAVELIAARAHGYPYLIQLLGSLAWAQASLEESGEITAETVEAILPHAVSRMGRQVHAPSLHGMPDSQLAFLVAMAQVADEDGRAATGDIAAELGVAPNGISTRRRALIDADLVAPAGYGYLSFTLPYLREYLLDAHA
ncbi:AAA family ATPase [Corynebacterium frankenforstense]